MGYTRYWERTEKPITREFVGAVIEIIEDCTKRGIKIRNGMGEFEPVITMNEIYINGDGERNLDHETLMIDNQRAGFDFCKTARKPYDYAVREILKEAEALGLVKNVHSDGANERIISDNDFLS